MRALSDAIARFASAVTRQRRLSRFVCAGCEMRDRCSLPAYRRRLCQEVRAVLPHTQSIARM
jgi:hypothetical protein